MAKDNTPKELDIQSILNKNTELYIKYQEKVTKEIIDPIRKLNFEYMQGKQDEKKYKQEFHNILAKASASLNIEMHNLSKGEAKQFSLLETLVQQKGGDLQQLRDIEEELMKQANYLKDKEIYVISLKKGEEVGLTPWETEGKLLDILAGKRFENGKVIDMIPYLEKVRNDGGSYDLIKNSLNHIKRYEQPAEKAA
ncbi:MAG: hypothetical protein PHG05_03815 [Candidatus Nanoarchaeia archaeon]|nr:hypothetical protein [Candidatus Nanoarchaeia archaeon]